MLLAKYEFRGVYSHRAAISGAIMKMNDQDRYGLVILSAAKNLCAVSEILRFTQNDIPDGGSSC